MSAIPLRTLLIAAGLCLGTGLAEVQAHQCVSVLILNAPTRVRAGSRAEMVAGVVNCGSCPTPVHLDVWLVDYDDQIRYHLGSDRLQLREGDARRVRIDLQIPASVRPGRYTLVLTGETPGGYMDWARAPIVVVEPTFQAIPRLLRRLMVDPCDLDALEELAEAGSDLAATAAGELGFDAAVVTGQFYDATVKHKWSDDDGNHVRVVIGNRQSMDFLVPNNVIEDSSGNRMTFRELRVGDSVDVDYKKKGGNKVATKIVKY